MLDLDAPPKAAVDAAGRFCFGRFPEPLEDADFAGAHLSDYPRLWGRARPRGLGAFLRRMRLKEYHFFGFVTDRHYLGLAVAHVGYLGTVFCYLVDRATGEVLEFGRKPPFGLGIRMAPSSVRGETSYRLMGERIGISARPGGWTVEVDVPLAGHELRGRIEVERDQALGLVYPLHENRAAYTHKEAGNRAHGFLMLGSQDVPFPEGRSFAVTDWTRAFSNRRTVWNWLSVAGEAGGRRFGLNLSARIYGDRENALWLDGRWRPLGPVLFEVPRDGRGPWRVEGDGVDLSVAAEGARREKVDLGLIAAGLVQAFGPVTGRVGDVQVDGAYGVVEDHLALW